jgi:hypothetical protein
MSLFAFPLFLVVFAGMSYVMVTQCFSLIYVLPDNILRWIGGPQTPTAMSAQQMAQQVGGHMQTAGQKGGELAQNMQKHKQMDKEKKSQHSTKGGGTGGGSGAEIKSE